MANKQVARIAAHGSGSVHVAWYDRRHGDYDVFYARSETGGATWGRDIKVSDDPGDAKQSVPSLAVGPGDLPYVVWLDEREGDVDVFFAAGLELSRQVYCPVALKSLSGAMR